jgi:hypothetical protein
MKSELKRLGLRTDHVNLKLLYCFGITFGARNSDNNDDCAIVSESEHNEVFNHFSACLACSS